MMDCVQICQKCLRWFSICFRRLFGFVGATVKAIIYLLACLMGMFISPKSFRWLFCLFCPKLLLVHVATLVFKFESFRTQSSHTLNRQF